MSDTNLTNPDSPSDLPAFEPQEWIVATAVPEPAAEAVQPPPVPRRPKVLLPVVLFLLTCASTLFVGAWIYGWDAWLYSLSLMTILVCHEAGHFIQTRRYRVPASLPFFIPAPIPPIGTIGAVIGMSPNLPGRRALFDIGISGPLAGLVPTIACVVLGLHHSTLVSAISGPNDLVLGEPLLMKFVAWYKFGTIPDGYTVALNPVLHAGWVGLLITSLNLFPIGQLDGGHILYALLKTRAHQIAMTLLVGAAACVVAFSALRPWLLMVILLTFMGPRHPPTRNDDEPLGAWRVALGWATLAFLPFGFTPIPIL